MKIVITHTEFSLYWKERLSVFAKQLPTHYQLVVIDVTSAGGVYDFAKNEPTPHIANMSWIHLFDNKNIFELPSREVFKAIWNCLESENPDIVVAGAIASTPGAAAVNWCRNKRRSVVIFDDARRVDVPRPWWVEFVKKRFYQNVDAVLIPAPSHAASYIEWGMPKEKIFFGVDVVDNQFFYSKSSEAKNKLKWLFESHNLPEKLFLGVGRQIPKKNWFNLIRAYGKYKQEGGQWGLVLVGGGPQHEDLKNYVLSENISGVHFKPFASQSTLCEYYAMAECFILASHHGETWGLVVNEAMACGLPVLVSNQCGCSQTLVKNGENGWTFDSSKIEEIKELMLKVSHLATDEMDAMKKKSLEIIEEWPIERFSQGLLDAINVCKNDKRGFKTIFDKIMLGLWKGRYIPT